VVTGLEVAVGFLVAWFVRKAGHAAKRLDAMADEVMDAQLDRLHEVVIGKLGNDSALEQLQLEAATTGEVGTRTQARVRLALEEAAEQDKTFAADLEAVLAKLRPGDHSIKVAGGVHSETGGVSVIMTGGSLSMDRPDPQGPARP
jgi:hypothetical protein